MGKTVTTYLIDGDPKGTQYSFISNKICQMFVVPRSNLSYLSEQEKLQKPAFYILIGEDEAIKPQAYIGETENFKERVKDHDNKKAFWQKALIFVSKDVTPSFNWRTKREQLIQEYVSTKNNQFVLNADVTFSSPSTAAAFCLGRSTNGWTTWKDIDNHTLDSIYRAQLE